MSRKSIAAFVVFEIVLAAAPALAQVVELSENFTSATAAAGGWTLTSGFWPAQNNSDNPQPYSANGGAWGPGGTLFNPAPNNGYFATDTTATGNANGTVSDWLMTPVLTLHNGDTIRFETRTRNPEEGPSRMEVRLSTSGTSTNVGTLSSDVGAFTTLVNTINLSLSANAYPTSWTTFTYTVSGLSSTTTGRVAFRTEYPNGGFAGPNGDTVGLAAVTYTAIASTTLAWTGASSGNWSNANNWSPAVTPTSNANNQFTFATTTNATMTNDIAGTLMLNRLTFNSGAPAYTLSGNGLNFVTNSSSVLPQIVTNSANSVTITAPVTLTNALTINGSGNLALNGLVSGAGGLALSGSGTVTLGNSSNSFTGGANLQNGTLQVAADGALGTGNITGSSFGILSYTGSTSTARTFTLGGGTVLVAANQTLTLNGSQMSGGFMDGSGTFATGATTGATFINMTSTPSVTITSNRATDQFTGFTNGGNLNVAANLPVGTTNNFSGSTNQGSGTITIGANSQVNAAGFQSFGVVNLNPGSLSTGGTGVTVLKNTGTSQLNFGGGSRTFIGTVPTATTFSAGIDLNGQNAVVTGGLLVNNGYVIDSTNSGAVVIADAGSLVKGAGFFQNSPVTRNGGVVQAGNSPGVQTQGTTTIGPGGTSAFNWQINNATSSILVAPDNGEVSGWSGIRAVAVQFGSITTHGDFNWTATPSNQFNFALQTLLNPTPPGGPDIQGPMDNFHKPGETTTQDGDQAFTWPFITFVGTYSGPTDPATLDADTVFDLTNFVNPHPGTFGWNLVVNSPPGNGGELDLVYTPAVPEPGTLALTSLAGMGFVWSAQRRRKTAGTKSES